MNDAPSQRLGTRTLRGMFWAYGSFASVRLASLVTTAILARVLAPKDFGLIALALTFMAFLDMLQGLGVGDALVVADPAELELEAETAFAVSSTVGVGLWILSAAVGPLAASFFHQPRLVEIMPALGLTFVFYGLGSTHYSLALTRIDFRSRTAAELADAVVRGATGITLALTGAGAWSLIIGYLAGSAAWMTVLWILVPWHPRYHPRRKHLRRLLGFGGALTGVGVMAAFLAQFDNAVVGRVLGPTQLGFYSIANRLPFLFIISLAAATGQVLYPAFAALQGEDLRRGFVTALRYTAVVALPLTAVLITLAEPITLAVFGPHWRPAIAATQVLCLWALMSPISMVCGNAIKSRGRAGLLLGLAIPQAIALVVGSLLLVRHGILAVSWVQAVIAILAQIVTLLLVCRMLSLTLRRAMAAIGPPLIASAVLAGLLLEVHHLISSPVLALVVGGAAGAVVYLGLVHLLMPNLVLHLRSMAFSRSAPAGAMTGEDIDAGHLLDWSTPALPMGMEVASVRYGIGPAAATAPKAGPRADEPSTLHDRDQSRAIADLDVGTRTFSEYHRSSMANEIFPGEPPRAAPYEQAIGPYLRAVRRNWILVLIITLLAGGIAAFTVTRLAKHYQATASIFVNALPQGDPAFVGIDTVISDGDPTRTIENAAALIDSPQAAAVAAHTLGPPWTESMVFGAVSVVPVGASDVLAVTASAPTASQAALVANDFANGAISYRAGVVQTEISSVLARLEARLAPLKGNSATDSSEASALSTNIEQLKAAQTPGHEPTMSVSQLAQAPSSPSGAPSYLVVLLGLVGGFALGSIAALGLETFSRPIRDRDDIESLFPLPVLATIPRMHRRHSSKGIRPWEFSAVAFEQMRMLRVQLSPELSILPAANPVIMVTSACAGDGKTTVAAALAAAFAEANQDVILMDLDMRKPQISELLGVEPTVAEPGDMLGRGVPAPVPRIPRVKVISAPRGNFASFEILLQRLPELLLQAQRAADCVIVDTAPVGEVSESLRIAAMCDQVLFVARPRETDRQRLMLARDLLTRASVPVVGLVLVGRDLGMPTSSYASPYTTSLTSPNGAENGADVSRVAEAVVDITAEPSD